MLDEKRLVGQRWYCEAGDMEGPARLEPGCRGRDLKAGLRAGREEDGLPHCGGYFLASEAFPHHLWMCKLHICLATSPEFPNYNLLGGP